MIEIRGKTTIEEDSILAIIGSKEHIGKFEEYETTLSKSPETIMIDKITEIFR